MASIEEAAAALAAALRSGAQQHAESALALYESALGDNDEPEVSLEPLKRSLAAPDNSVLASEVDNLDADADADGEAVDEGDEVQGSQVDDDALTVADTVTSEREEDQLDR
jgi:hypothetical protein